MSVKFIRIPDNIDVKVTHLSDYDSSRPLALGLVNALKNANFPSGSLVFGTAETYGGSYQLSGASFGSWQSYLCHSYSNNQSVVHVICDNGSWRYETL